MDAASMLERFLDRPRVAYIREVVDTYRRAAGGLLANGLAFAALFATIPVALVTLGLAGWLVDDPRIQASLASALVRAFPPLRELITGSLDALTTGAPIASIVGLVGMVWTVSQLYVALDVAVSRIFSDVPERDGLRRAGRGFLWVGLLCGAVIVVIVAGSLAGLADAFLPAGFPLGAALISIVTSAPVLVVVAIGAVISIYRVLPARTPAWSSLLLPATVVGVVVVALAQAFVLLAPRLVGFAALAGALATLFIALAWLSLTFQTLLYGAAWVRVRDDRAQRAAPSDLGGAAAAAESSRRGE